MLDSDDMSDAMKKLLHRDGEKKKVFELNYCTLSGSVFVWEIIERKFDKTLKAALKV